MGTLLNVAQEDTDSFFVQVLELNYTIMNHRNFVDNFWIGIWYDKDVAKLELLK